MYFVSRQADNKSVFKPKDRKKALTWDELSAEAETLAEVKNLSAQQRLADDSGAVQAVADAAGLVVKTGLKFASAAARGSTAALPAAEEKAGRRRGGGARTLPSGSPPAGARGTAGRGRGLSRSVKLEAKESPPAKRTINLDIGGSDITK